MAAYTTIDDPEAYFQVVLYTGNGAADHAITLGGSTDMQPDFVWIKNRDTTDSHCLFDAVRGVTKLLYSDNYTAEATDTDTLDAFQTDGFRVDADVKVNTDTEKYVAWCWKANGSGSSNTDGSINTTATSANTTSGFSISNHVGTGSAATVGHGLGAKPHFMIVRERSLTGSDTSVYHGANTAAPETDVLFLYNTSATADNAAMWNDVAPTSSVFTVGTSGATNNSSTNHISWVWTNIQGFSKFGTYEGNANTNGRFVYTGFRPALIITKSIDSTSAWHMFDDQREGYNVDNDALEAESTTVEATADQIDILSNGFKFRITTDPNVAETYVYMAWAKAPFVNSEGVPCNAR